MDEVDLGAFKNSQWASCASDEIARQDVVLNREYNALRSSLSPEQRVALTKAQKAWLAYREGWCRFDEAGPSAPGGIAGYYFCMLELNDVQIDALESMQP